MNKVGIEVKVDLDSKRRLNPNQSDWSKTIRRLGSFRSTTVALAELIKNSIQRGKKELSQNTLWSIHNYLLMLIQQVCNLLQY